MEIGSLYEINPASVKKGQSLCSDDLSLQEVHKYGKSHTSFTASGREAVALALKSIEKFHPEVAKRCLMPAYMCDSVFFPFQRAGWELSFYHIDRQMKADPEELQERILESAPGVLFIHNYYGQDTWKTLRPFLKKLQNQGIMLMEDMTQAYYLREEEYCADYIVGSLRKWFYIPDGGFLTTNQNICQEEIAEKTDFASDRLELQIQKWNCLYGNEEIEKKEKSRVDYLKKNRETEEWLDHFPGISALSDFASRILIEENEEKARQQRNQNYSVLSQGICGLSTITALWKESESVEAPLYFPIYADDRKELQSFLGSRGIYAPVLWPIGIENQDFLGEEERYIYEHLLALPLDQRYGVEQMEQILWSLKEYDYEQKDQKRVVR